MSDLNYMLDKIESQLGTRVYKTEIFDYPNNYNIGLRNTTYLYGDNNLNFSRINKPNFKYTINIDNNNNNYYKNAKLKQVNTYTFDKMSNGAKDYDTNNISIPQYQQNEAKIVIQKEIEPYSYNIQEELKETLNNTKKN